MNWLSQSAEVVTRLDLAHSVVLFSSGAVGAGKVDHPLLAVVARSQDMPRAGYQISNIMLQLSAPFFGCQAVCIVYFIIMIVRSITHMQTAADRGRKREPRSRCNIPYNTRVYNTRIPCLSILEHNE